MRRSLLLQVFAAGMASNAWCAPVADADAGMLLATHYRIDEVVVTGSRVETSLQQTPLSIDAIDHSAIDQKAPAFTGEVLNTVPGVRMTDLGNEQHSMSIRQPMTTAAVYSYMEDGIPLRPTGLFNHNSLYEVNLEGAERIEILKGPASSLYGSNSVGGTVNFLTEAPSQEFTAKLSAQASDQGYWRTGVNVSGSVGDFGGRFSGYVSRRNGGWQDYNNAEKESFTARGDWQVNDSTKIKTVLTHNHLYTDMPGSLRENYFHNNPDMSANHFTYREVDADRASVVVDGDWLDIGTTSLTVYARKNSTEQNPSYSIADTSAVAATGLTNDNDFTSLGADIRQQFNFNFLESRLIVGITADNTDNDYVEDNTNIVRNPNTGEYLSDSFASHRRDYNAEIENRAAYAQLETTPVRDVRVVLGGRYDKTTYDFTNYFVPSDSTGSPSEKRDFDHFSPKLGVIWSPLLEHSFYLNHAQGFVPPEVSTLYARAVVPNIKESVFTNDEIGWRSTYLSNRVQLNIALYRLDGEDEVVNYTPPAPAVQRAVPVNAGKTRHQGIEIGVGWHINKEWQTQIAAAYSKHEYREYRASSTLDYSGKDIPNAPAWIGNTQLTWTPEFVPGFSAELEWQYLSSYEMNNANTIEYGGFNLFNLRLSQDIANWRVWMKGTNLADKHYAETATSSYSGAGAYLPNTQNSYSPGNPRTVSIGVEYRL